MTATAAAPASARPLLRLLRLAGPWRAGLALGCLAGAATVGAAIALMGASGFLIARAAQHPNEAALAVAVVGVRAFGLSRGFFRYAERLATHDAAFRVLADLRARVYARLARIAPAGLGARGGDLLARLVGDVDAVQDLLVRGVTPVVVAAVAGGGVVAVLATVYAPAAALLGLGLAAAGIAVPGLAARLNRHAGAALAPARGRLAAHTVDTLTGAADLLAYGAADAATAAFDEINGEMHRVSRRAAAVAGLGNAAVTLVSGLTVFGVLLAGVAAVGHRSLGTVPLTVLVLAGLAAFEATAPLLALGQQVAGMRASGRRVFDVLDAPDPVARPARPCPLPAGPAHLRLAGARLRYTPDGPWALDGVDLDLPPGRRVALVGPSGAGKSSVAAVLLRFRDLTTGSATLGGVPLTELDPDAVRTLVGGVPADPHIFDSTLRENLRLARPDAGPAALADAARRARLLDWVDSLPAGWDTPVGAHGAAISGGQRQRLALARALLADPPVFVLDEPTAHLDPDTAAALTADLLAATAGRTTLWITHDLTGLDALDAVVTLRAGRVVATTPADAPR